jgi:DNA repair exonuclease SbcCD ATPase subunit
VKECQRCGAQRGPHQIAKLDIDLTNRSGAAEDLAGIAVQLSASNWLRLKRCTPWTGACIDEPFGALDATNKRALAMHVATMLLDRFDLALVVAHDRGILDALPSQVAIVADEDGSKLEG